MHSPSANVAASVDATDTSSANVEAIDRGRNTFCSLALSDPDSCLDSGGGDGAGGRACAGSMTRESRLPAYMQAEEVVVESRKKIPE